MFWNTKKMIPIIKKSISAGGVVLNQKGEVLVVSQKGTSWSLPKGHVEGNEDLITAAKREIEEESGVINLQFVKELGSYERTALSDPTELKTIHMFLFRTKQLDLKPIDPENPEARWVNKNEVTRWLTAEKDKEFFTKIKDQL